MEVSLKRYAEAELRLFADFHVVCDFCREVKYCAEIEISPREKKVRMNEFEDF